jgi:hypothetical protein
MTLFEHDLSRGRSRRMGPAGNGIIEWLAELKRRVERDLEGRNCWSGWTRTSAASKINCT